MDHKEQVTLSDSLTHKVPSNIMNYLSLSVHIWPHLWDSVNTKSIAKIFDVLKFFQKSNIEESQTGEIQFYKLSQFILSTGQFRRNLSYANLNTVSG